MVHLRNGFSTTYPTSYSLLTNHGKLDVKYLVYNWKLIFHTVRSIYTNENTKNGQRGVGRIMANIWNYFNKYFK